MKILFSKRIVKKFGGIFPQYSTTQEGVLNSCKGTYDLFGKELNEKEEIIRISKETAKVWGFEGIGFFFL